ncbi:MAG: hypothetical protein PVI30_04800 [Myxococcales bacterium]|jgi:hypothetical protein
MRAHTWNHPVFRGPGQEDGGGLIRGISHAALRLLRSGFVRRIAEWVARHRRVLSRGALTALVVAVVVELWPSVPRDTDLEFQLGPAHGRIAELRIAYMQRGEELHGVSLRFDGGAPESVRHTVSLPSGDFELRCELRDESGTSRTLVRSLTTPTDGLVRIRLHGEGPT